MKKTLAFLLALSMAVCAAPSPWGIAVNEVTGQCGGFWAGDEYTRLHLPSGWTAYYPRVINDRAENKIVTPKGACSFIQGDAKYCCKQLGLDYAGENVGVTSGKPIQDKTLAVYLSAPGRKWTFAYAFLILTCGFVVAATYVYFHNHYEIRKKPPQEKVGG